MKSALISLSGIVLVIGGIVLYTMNGNIGLLLLSAIGVAIMMLFSGESY